MRFDTMTMTDVQELEFQIMKESGASQEDLVRLCVRRYNEMTIKRYSWLPWGRSLAISQLLDEEEEINKIKK